MKNVTSDLPPELQPFASPLDAQPPEVQEAFQFLLATAMHEVGRFEPRDTRKATKGAKYFRGLCFWVQLSNLTCTQIVRILSLWVISGIQEKPLPT